VLVRFKGQIAPGITIARFSTRDSLYAIKQGLFDVAKQARRMFISGRILEIEGLPNLKVEQAFLNLAMHRRTQCCRCNRTLDKAPVIEYLNRTSCC